MEVWKERKREAEGKVKGKKRVVEGRRMGVVDAEGKDGKEEGLWEGFEDIDVGLRVFMENERRIKKRREVEMKEREKK